MDDKQWNFPVEIPDTEDVYMAYLNWYDPEYRNPDAQAAWTKVNRAEFDAWLEGIKREAKADGHREGYATAREDMISGAFIGGPTYEALRASFSGQKIRQEGYREGYNQGQDDVYNPRTLDEED